MNGDPNQKNFRVKITEIKIKMPFIKLFLQNVNGANYQNLMNLKDLYKSLPSTTDIQINDLCLGKVDFDVRRCRVISLDSLKATVEFIDYGFMAKTPRSVLKLIPKDSKFLQMKKISKEFLLANVIINEFCLNYRKYLIHLYENLIDKEFDMKIIGKTESLDLIELSSNGKLISPMSYAANALKTILLTDQINAFNIIYHPEAVQQLEGYGKVKVEREILPESPNTETRIKYFENPRVPIHYKIGESYSVHISHVENLQNFYVIHVADFVRYSDLQDTLNDIILKPITEDPIIGEKYLILPGDFESPDLAAHRIVVKKIDKNKKCVCAFFIDKGITDFIPFDLIFELPYELKVFSNFDPYVTKFSLFKADVFTTHLNEKEQKYYFEFHTKNIQLTLKVEDEGVASLFDPTMDKGILEMVWTHNPRALVYAVQEKLEKTNYKIQICYVVSNDTFYARLYNNSHKSAFKYIKSLTEDEYELCQLGDPSIGNVCCVVSQGEIRRGLIVNITQQDDNSSLYQVLHVDYGYCDDYRESNIFILLDNFVKEPPCAFRFQLCKSATLDDDDDDEDVETEVSKKYESMRCVVEVLNDDINGTYLVKLLSASFVQRNESTLSLEHLTASNWSIKNDEEKFIIILSSITTINDFTLQLVENTREFKRFTKIIQNISKEITNDPGVNCVRDISHDKIYLVQKGEEWCRASLFEVTDMKNVKVWSLYHMNPLYSITFSHELNDDLKEIKMRDVDTGEVFSIINKTQIYPQPNELMLIPYFGIRCSLPCVIKDDKEEDALNYLKSFLNKDIHYQLLSAEPTINIVQLFHDDIVIAYEMLKLGFVENLTMPLTGQLYVIQVNTLNNFYVHLIHELPLFDHIRLFVNSAYEQIMLKDIELYQVVLVKYNEGTYNHEWYRGEVLKVGAWEFKVFLFDIGIEVQVSIDDIGAIPVGNEWLKNIPRLARNCSLNIASQYNPKDCAAVKELKKYLNEPLDYTLSNFEREKFCISLKTYEIDINREINEIIQPTQSSSMSSSESRLNCFSEILLTPSLSEH